MSYLIDRMTVGWHGPAEVREAEQFRKMVGVKGVSPKMKELARAWMKEQGKKR